MTKDDGCQRMIKRILNALFIVVFVSLLLLNSIYIFVLKEQQSLSYIENRNLFTLDTLASDAFPELSFQNHLEKVLEDQILYRYEIVQLKKNINYFFSSLLIPLNSDDSILNPIGETGTLKRVGTSNYIIKALMEYEERIEERVQRRIIQYNDISRAFPDTDFYVYYPQQAHESDIFNLSNEQESYGAQVEAFFEELLEINYKKLEYDTVEEFKSMFYASDHHWNHLGSYQAYLDIMSMFDDTVKPIEPVSVDCSYSFHGTFSTQTGFVLAPDTFCLYDFNLENYEIIQDGELIAEPIGTQYFYSKADEFNPNTYFYNVAYPYSGAMRHYSSEINTQSILVVGDSYMPPILPLLSQHYGNVYALQPFVYYSNNRVRFDYYKFIAENKIDKVLFMPTIENYFFDDEYGKRFEAFDVLPMGE
jgi:hypothetical protein